jgi:hypothetical protein
MLREDGMSDKPTPVFAVRLSSALRVKPFVSDEDSRYYLQGVCIEPAQEGATCASTDGHRLGVYYDKEGYSTGKAIVRLPPEIKMPAKKKGLFASPWLVGVRTGAGKGYVAVVEPAGKGEDDTAQNAIERVEDCIIRIGNALIDGSFPDWRRVIPKPTERDTVRAFNGEYVKAFGKHMTLRGADAASAHLIEISGEPNFLGVLMPMRADSKGKLPDWLEAPKAPARKKAA